MNKIILLTILLISSCGVQQSESAGENTPKQNNSAKIEAEIENTKEQNSSGKVKSNDLSTVERPIVLGENATVKSVIHKNNEKKGSFYFNLHDNENTSVEATTEHIREFGGTLVELVHTGERLISFDLAGKSFKFDPNRMFSAVGVEKNLKKYNGKGEIAKAKNEVDKLSGLVIKDFIVPNKSLIITIHNNTDNGGLTINTYKPNTLETADVYIAKDEDVDNFFYVTERKHFDALANGEFNVVLQNNEFIRNNRSIDDGSLSIYCGLEGIPYINVETQHGNVERQKEMLKALQKIS